MKRHSGIAVLIILLVKLISTNLSAQKIDHRELSFIADSVNSTFKKKAFVTSRIRLDSAIIFKKELKLYFNNSLSEYFFTNSTTQELFNVVEKLLPQSFSQYKLNIFTNGSQISELVPPILKDDSWKKSGREHRKALKELNRITPLFINNSKPYRADQGLDRRHIAIWQSHGIYYNQKLMRWEWQRPRLFQTVEDLFTTSFIIPYLAPMLENAGAVVLMPRERDVQTHEVIVDNDNQYSGYSEYSGLKNWMTSGIPGFNNSKQSYLFGENPFSMGTAKVVETITKGDPSTATWRANFPEDGLYSVYISYQSFPNSSSAVLYTVHHAGGNTEFIVNQKIGGGTWIHLGQFSFKTGGTSRGYVTVSNLSNKKGELVSADAVKFGGGMGNIARKPSEEGVEQNRKSSSTEPVTKQIISFSAEETISNYPRFAEGSRYWLQWAGFNDTIYSPNKNSNDYNDDYMSRGRWVNVLSGGSPRNPKESGLKIPIDLAFAFHTDAGVTKTDSTIGTLGIYTRFSNGNDTYPDGKPRISSRYLTDLIQSQIVDDIRELYDPIWQRRGLWDRSYSESRSPQVPTMLLELLSHQNFSDMRYGLDPNFRFDVSRAIYKGMLKFISQQSGLPYVVQPLPVKNFAALLEGDTASLSWTPVIDRLETTATPHSYIVYTRVNGEGFDNGVVTTNPYFKKEIERGKIYSFKISALNDGGESFPSEILSLYKSPNEKGNVLIINGFDKVSAPNSFRSKDTTIAGFMGRDDYGVPYLFDISYTGDQHDFEVKNDWLDNDAPGLGASYANHERDVLAGNTFDYPYVHGRSFAKEGLSFSSVSRGALDRVERANVYTIVDVILGKQGSTTTGRGYNGVRFKVFPKILIDFLTDYANSGGNIFVSGMNVGTDIWVSAERDTNALNFAQNILKYKWRTDRATASGDVTSSSNPFGIEGRFIFQTKPGRLIYNSHSPDGIEPNSADAWTIMRYTESGISAGVAYKGEYRSIVFGFPIETLINEADIDAVIKSVVEFFNKE